MFSPGRVLDKIRPGSSTTAREGDADMMAERCQGPFPSGKVSDEMRPGFFALLSRGEKGHGFAMVSHLRKCFLPGKVLDATRLPHFPDMAKGRYVLFR